MENVYTFKVIYNDDKIEMRRIFPTKQIFVKRIREQFRNDDRIACIMVFGSAVSIKCNKWSDIDLLVRLKDNAVSNSNKNEISECIQELCDWNADIIWFDRIDKKDRIYNEILKGVQIV